MILVCFVKYETLEWYKFFDRKYTNDIEELPGEVDAMKELIKFSEECIEMTKVKPKAQTKHICGRKVMETAAVGADGRTLPYSLIMYIMENE